MATSKKITFSEKDIEKRLRTLSGWHLQKKGGAIAKTFKTPNFISGLAFVAKIAVHAEIMNHHPEIELTYRQVKVCLTTHDEDGLTKKDFELAERIESIKVS